MTGPARGAVAPPPQRRAGRAWTPAEIDALGVCTDLMTAGSIFGLGRTKAYELCKAGQFPVEVLRVGARFRVPTASIRHSLGLAPLCASVSPVDQHPDGVTKQKEAA